MWLQTSPLCVLHGTSTEDIGIFMWMQRSELHLQELGGGFGQVSHLVGNPNELELPFDHAPA
jgi:hypothetical protein